MRSHQRHRQPALLRIFTRMYVGCIDLGLRLSGAGLLLGADLLGLKHTTRLGKWIGTLSYAVRREKRTVLKQEVNTLFGYTLDSNRIRDISKKSFINFHKRQIETALFGSLDMNNIKRAITIDGIDHLNRALKGRKGVILLLSHFGSFLLPLPTLGFMGYRVNQVTGKQLHTSLLSERIWQWRKQEADRLPVNFIQVGKFLRPIYLALKRNEVVALAFDGRDGVKWVVSDFVGSKAYFSTGPFELARRTGATIIPTFVIRGKDDIQRIELHEPFRLSNAPDPDTALKSDARRFAGLLGSYVQRYPCHFGMILYNYRNLMKKGHHTPFFVEKSYGNRPHHPHTA